MGGRLSVLGLALFVAVDVLLVTLAVRHVQSPPPPPRRPDAALRSPTAAPTPTSTPGPSRAPTSSSAPTASPRPAAASASGPIAFLSVGDDSTVLRTARGDCGAGQPLTVVVSRGGDAGMARPVADLTEVLAVRVASRRDLEVIGLNARCRVGRYTSADGGQSWTRRKGADGTWHLVADPTASSVVSPTGERSTPCVPISLVPVDSSTARVLCRMGRVRETQDAGASWRLLGRVRGAVDMSFTTRSDGVTLAKRPGCRAAVMQTLDGGRGWSRLVCLPGGSPQAIGVLGDVIGAQVGDELLVSTDSGATWPTAPER